VLVVAAVAMLIAAGLPGPVGGATIIAATAAYGIVIAVLGGRAILPATECGAQGGRRQRRAPREPDRT
jgi:hypothetical protein